MRQYLDTVRHVLAHGTRKENRTGVDTLSTFNYNYEIDLRDGFPLLTTKTVSWKNIVVEMLWFLSGQTDIAILKRHGCKFWDAWADPETGKVPSAYGNFWRQFPTHGGPVQYRSGGVEVDFPNGSPAFNDQIAWVLAELQRNPMSRRMVVSAWAPGNAQTSKLPPCHSIFMLNVQNLEEPLEEALARAEASTPTPPPFATKELRHDFIQQYLGTPEGRVALRQSLIADGFTPKTGQRLCLHLTQRSCDVALGVPYNIASYALLLSIFSHLTGIEPGIFAHTLVDAHIYTAKPDGSMAEFDHVPGLREQVKREPYKLPRLVISPEIKSLADIERLMESDITTEEVMRHFVLEGYSAHPAINFKVAV